MRRRATIGLVALVALVILWSSSPDPMQAAERGLTLSTPYPAQVVQAGETVTLSLALKIRNLPPQVVRLEMGEVAPGWTATFLGGGRAVRAVYVEPDVSASVSLKLEPPEGVEPGTYRFVAVARGEGTQAELSVELTVEEELPPQLDFEVELPTLQGTPSTTFRYRATLTNESAQELLVNLSHDAPQGFEVTFRTALGSQEVSSLPLKAGESKDLDITVDPPSRAAAGEYKIPVRAQAGAVGADLVLRAVVTGQPDLQVTTPEGRLSLRATIGRKRSLQLVIRNSGSAPARDVTLSASQPSGWTVEFEPESIVEIPPEGEVQATALLTPSEKSVAGDYMVTVTARTGGDSDSAELRVTAEASTLWGIVGIVLIAVAVGVVGLAVVRFGRR